MIYLDKKIGILALLLFLAVLPVEAKEKKNNKKKNYTGVTIIEPDPIARKAKPDSHPKGLEAPKIFFSDGSYLHGLDMSHYQGRISWQDVASDPHSGYIYLKATEGASLVDDTYEYNFREARKVGLKVGSYHFFRANVSAKEQFENFMSVVDKSKQDLLPLIDVEILPRGISIYQFHARLEDFLKMVEKEFGKKPMIYTGKNFYNKYFADSKFKKYKFMIAAYTIDEPVLDNDDDYLIWQYTGKGSAKGVRGHVDMSRFRGGHSLREILY